MGSTAMFGGASSKTSAIACTCLLGWDRVLELLLVGPLGLIKAQTSCSFSFEYLRNCLDRFVQDVSENCLLYLDRAGPRGTMWMVKECRRKPCQMWPLLQVLVCLVCCLCSILSAFSNCQADTKVSTTSKIARMQDIFNRSAGCSLLHTKTESFQGSVFGNAATRGNLMKCKNDEKNRSILFPLEAGCTWFQLKIH